MFSIYVFDIASTLVLFLLSTSVVLLLSVYCVHTLGQALELTNIRIGIWDPPDNNALQKAGITLSVPVIARLDLNHPLDAFAKATAALIRVTFDDVYWGFRYYYLLTISYHTQAELHAGGPLKDLPIHFEYPFTTLFATAFCTNIWVGFTAALLLVTRFWYRFSYSFRNLLLSLYDSPRKLFVAMIVSWFLLLAGIPLGLIVGLL